MKLRGNRGYRKELEGIGRESRVSEGIRGEFKGILSKECLGLKKPHAKVSHKRKNAREGCHFSTINVPFVHLVFS